MMHARNVPEIDTRYWIAIIASSMCGANAGDLFARNLHLGHAIGLLPLAALFLLVLFAERRSTWTTEVFYWVAIIVLRTAATNLADLALHDFKVPDAMVQAGLTVLLVLFVWLGRPGVDGAGTRSPALPATDANYWVAMLTAGTLGTALGDYVADELLGLGLGSVALAAVYAATLAATYRFGPTSKGWYWASIVAARTAGTTMGDFIASKKGVGFGLPLSLLCTSSLLVAILVLWRRRGRDATMPA